MSPLPAPMTQPAYLALEQFQRRYEDLEAGPALGAQRACVLWMIARGLCGTRAEFHEHFQPGRWITAAIDALVDEGLLLEDAGGLRLRPAGLEAVGASHRFAAAPELHAGRATYALERRVAAGAQGEVWTAWQVDPLERRVAVKLVAQRGDVERSAMLFREAAVMAAVAHSGIPVVCDTGTARDGRPFFAMELVEGRPLDAFCDEHGLALEERLDLFLRTCAIVRHVHERGFLHRDIKPENILVGADPDRAVKLIDFGLALALHAEQNEPGRVQGTPTHMSPEQASGVANLDQRADVHGLGVILFELTTGLSPVRAADLESAGDDISGVVGAEKVPASIAFARSPVRWELAARRGTDAGTLRRMLRAGLDDVIRRAIAVDRDRRYDDVASLAADVAWFLSGEVRRAARSRRAPRLLRSLLVLAVVAAVGFAAGALWCRA